jgi:hypothetical protein
MSYDVTLTMADFGLRSAAVAEPSLYISTIRDCAGRDCDRSAKGETRLLAALNFFLHWPEETGCVTRNLNKPVRDRGQPDGTLSPAGDDGIEYHSWQPFAKAKVRAMREEGLHDAADRLDEALNAAKMP